VGKTEVARTLAEYLFNDENAMIRIDMSEYQERHAVSRLIGAPPGYVGYDEGGQLTEAVRRKPYSVILLDEIEKAHPDVWNILLQVLDEGRLTDNKGRVANFKNTIIVMTSNLGSNLIQAKFGEDEGWNHELVREEAKRDVMELLKQTIRPEFLNRIDEIVMFDPLTRQNIRKIVDIQFREIRQRLSENGIQLDATDEALDKVGEEGFDPAFGARPLKRVLQRRVLNALSKAILSGEVKRDSVVLMELDNDGEIAFSNLDAEIELD
jgi:ATP-dependent Clp protease ATP-binding subunit ClpB